MQAPTFIPIDLLFGLPEYLINQTLFVDVEVASAASNKQSPLDVKKTSGSGFKFSKAVSGITKKGQAAEDECSYNTRGDGKFQDGSSMQKKGNYVMLGPDALSDENAEATLANLDRMSSAPAKAPQPSKPSTSYQKESSYDTDMLGLSRLVDDAARMRPRPQNAFQSVQDAAKGFMFDLNDDDRHSSATAASAPLPEPEYSTRQLDADETGPSRMEVRVLLPSIQGAAEANVDISNRGLKLVVHGKCCLNLSPPFPVDEVSAQAKWNKAKRELTITLPKATAGVAT